MSDTVDRQLIESANAAAIARTNEALTVVVSAQHDLAEALGGAALDPLPVAADPPYLGAYATRFDELFANRTAPVQIRAIHKTLPTLYLAIQQRAQAAAAAVAALDRAEQGYLQGRAGIESYLAAFELASSQRQAFLAIARAYNDDIADYAINVARDGTGAVELTAMLIRVRGVDAQNASRRTQPPLARAAEVPRHGVASDRAAPARAADAAGTITNGAADWRTKERSPQTR
jgi:hypothetical protein